MRRIRDATPDDTADLFEFAHQVGLGVQPSGCIDDQDFNILPQCGFDRVIHDCARIGALAACDDRHPDALRPCLKLFGGGGSKGIAGGQQNALAELVLQSMRQLGNHGRLPNSVDADDQDDIGMGLEGGAPGLVLEHPNHLGLKHLAHFAGALDTVSVGAILSSIDQVHTCFDANIGLDQQCLQVLPEFVGDRVVGGEQSGDLAEETTARLFGRLCDLLLLLLGLLFCAWRILATPKQPLKE